jgi:hypothetical protein
MPRRTPIEQAIAKQTNRQARYSESQREKGLTQVAVWVPAGEADAFRRLGAILREWHEAGELATVERALKGDRS